MCSPLKRKKDNMKMKISRKRLQQLVTEEYENLAKEGLLTEAQGDVFAEGERVIDDRNGSLGTVLAPMAGGAVVELDDGGKVKIRAKFLSKVEDDPRESLDMESIEELVREEIAAEMNSILKASSTRK